MASASDTEMEYLSPSFDPSVLTIPRLRAILVSHDISYPASAKKPQLIDIFTQELIPRSRRILAARSRTKRTSRGITDMPSSQEGTVDSDEGDNTTTMPPPPIPDSTRRRARKSEAVMTESTLAQSPVSGRLKSTRRTSGKHPRPSDTETELELEPKRPSVRKTRKSEGTPTVNFEESEDVPTRPALRESAFSYDNPFQSGSSPLSLGDSRRRSGGPNSERRKSSSRRRKTEGGGSAEPSRIHQEDGVVVPSAKTFEVPVRRVRKSSIKDIKDGQDDGVEVGEEFTEEEQLELVRQRAANGDRDVLPPRRKKTVKRPSSTPKSAPWVVLMTLLSGYAMWWRREKLEVGYCGIGRPTSLLANFQVPEWTSSLQPACEPCPQHAICYERLQTKCDHDFVLQPHPFSMGGLVPLPPTCEPDGEKVRRVKAVADRAVEELRERKARWECGTLVDDKGKSLPAVEIDERTLKEEVGKKRRRGMGDAEFEDLWNSALGELTGREEIVHSSEGHPHHILLASTSLARLPLACAIRRSIRLALARNRIQLSSLALLLGLLSYARLEIRTRRAATARVPVLVTTTLDRLATQAALYAKGAAVEGWISVGQLRDDVLRDEFSAKRREGIWKLVRDVVEMNANVRASVREGRAGDVSRVWEWIGSVSGLGEDAWSSGDGRRISGRGTYNDGNDSGMRVAAAVDNSSGGGSGAGGERRDLAELRKWDEGRPIY